jgi:hypothetical protein
MARTQIRSGQLGDGEVQRDDLNATTTGQAVVKKLVESTGVQLTSTGVDAGTGDVTVATRAADVSTAGHVSIGTQTFGGRKTFDGQYVSGPIHDNGNSGSGTVTIDWDNGNSQLLTLTGSPTLAFSNGVSGGRYLLEIRTGAGGFTITWPSVTWMRSGGTAPTIPTAASKTALVGLSYNGSTYIGSYGDNS